MVSTVSFLLVLLLVGALAWGLARVIGPGRAAALFSVGCFGVVYVMMPAGLEPYFGWIRDLVSGIGALLGEVWGYVKMLGG